jgi:uroporphyrin-III C-methyltransferase
LAVRTADTQVYYMAGRQLAALSHRLQAAGWTGDTPVSVVSRAGWPDMLHSDHTVSSLSRAAMLHAGRPTVVTLGAGAAPISQATNEAALIAAVGVDTVAQPRSPNAPSLPDCRPRRTNTLVTP